MAIFEPQAICVLLDDGKRNTICIVCAEQRANKSGDPHLFWAWNFIIPCDISTRCPKCNKKMGRKYAWDAFERVAAEAKAEMTRRERDNVNS